MRADRLLSMLWLLMSEERLAAPEIARRLEVAPRTVLRDVEALSAAGVPVYCERGRAGGVRLLPGFRTNVSGLSEAETQALFAAVAASGAEALGRGPALASALRKVVAGLPAERRPDAVDVAARVVIEPAAWVGGAPVPHLAALQAVALGDRRARLRYRSRAAGSASWRTVDPYGLVCSAGVWYLVAGVRGAPRVFRANRVLAVEPTDLPSRRPEGLDVRELWCDLREGFRAETDPVEVDLVVEPGVARELVERSAVVHMAERADPAAETAGAVPDPLHVTFGDARHARSVVRALGPRVEVLRPAWLRTEVAEEARAVLARYR